MGSNSLTKCRVLPLADRYPNDFWGRNARNRAREEASRKREREQRIQKATATSGMGTRRVG